MKAQINVEFNESPNRQELQSGEEIKTLFGKIKKWLTDLKPVAFSGSYNDLTDTPDAAITTNAENIANIQTSLNSKASSADVYTKSESDNRFLGINNTAFNSQRWGNILNEMGTQNNTDTWLLVLNKDRVQHRLSTDFAEVNHSHTDVYTKSETDTKITEKVAEIVAGAPADFDTLKEMSDWIKNHEGSAAAMNSAINANAGNIANLQADIGDIQTVLESVVEVV